MRAPNFGYLAAGKLRYRKTRRKSAATRVELWSRRAIGLYNQVYVRSSERRVATVPSDLPVEEQRTHLRALYDSLRTSLMNRFYYEKRLKALQRYNKTFEILIAIGASGSAIGAWAVWKAGSW